MALNKGFVDEKCVRVPFAASYPAGQQPCDATAVSGSPQVKENSSKVCSSHILLFSLICVSLSFNIVTAVWVEKLQSQIDELSDVLDIVVQQQQQQQQQQQLQQLDSAGASDDEQVLAEQQQHDDVVTVDQQGLASFNVTQASPTVAQLAVSVFWTYCT